MNNCPMCAYKDSLLAESIDLDFDGVATVEGVLYTCPECKETFEGYQRLDEIHDVIARTLVSRQIAPNELRWLRKFLGFSTAAWGDFVGKRRKAVEDWEKGQTKIPKLVEELLRRLVCEGERFHDYHARQLPESVKPRIKKNTIDEWAVA